MEKRYVNVRNMMVAAIGVALILAMGLLLAGCASQGAQAGEVKPPLSASEAVEKNCEDVKLQFEKAGFTNVITEGKGDLITGWLHDDGEVYEVSIDGNSSFTKSTGFDADAKVVIRHHSYPETSSSSAKAESEPSSASSSSSGSSSAAESLDVSGYAERPLLEVCDELKAKGIPFKLVHESSGMDMTTSYEFGDFDDGGMVVTGASVESGGSVRLTIISRQQRDEQRAAAAQEQALTSKLDAATAWVAAASYGKSLYPYGFKLHYIIGKLEERAEDENTWFLKAYCDVTNAYGAKATNLNCEARVTGTIDDPQVTYFVVY